jgi:hypothetical protein
VHDGSDRYSTAEDEAAVWAVEAMAGARIAFDVPPGRGSTLLLDVADCLWRQKISRRLNTAGSSPTVQTFILSSYAH